MPNFRLWIISKCVCQIPLSLKKKVHHCAPWLLLSNATRNTLLTCTEGPLDMCVNYINIDDTDACVKDLVYGLNQEEFTISSEVENQK